MRVYCGGMEATNGNYKENELLDHWTHTGAETHQHNLCSLSSPANLSLETIIAVAALLIGLMNHWQTEENNYFWSDWTAEQDGGLSPRLKWSGRKKNCWENRACVHDSCLLKQCGEQIVQQKGEMMHRERNGTRNPCAGVDVSRESMG